MPDDATFWPVIGVRQPEGPDNAYVKRNCDILGRLGDVQPVPRARDLALLFLGRLITFQRLKIYDVMILNWAENVLTQRGGKLTHRGILEYRVFLWLCRRLSRKLVYVRHNELPHGTTADDAEQVNAWVERGQQRANIVVAHSPVYAEAHGYAYVPHPLYNVAPSSASPCKEYVVFGRVEPYKNIDQLIENWTVEATLVIVGPCSDPAYLDKLRALAKDKPVTFDIGFKEEQEIADRIAASAGVLIANTPESAIVSGTLFFALSCGAPVFALTTPFFEWLATTSLGNSVFAFESVDALTDTIGNDDFKYRASAAAIKAEADALFGDDHVLAAWQDVFGKLFGDTDEAAA